MQNFIDNRINPLTLVSSLFSTSQQRYRDWAVIMTCPYMRLTLNNAQWRNNSSCVCAHLPDYLIPTACSTSIAVIAIIIGYVHSLHDDDVDIMWNQRCVCVGWLRGLSFSFVIILVPMGLIEWKITMKYEIMNVYMRLKCLVRRFLVCWRILWAKFKLLLLWMRPLATKITSH